MKVPIVEIFSSFQGEGLWIGRRQIFVRFAGCNLSCDYCDIASSQSTDSGILMSVDEVVEKIKGLKTSDLHSISFTGGEPLLYAEFINEMVNKLTDAGTDKIYNTKSNKIDVKIMIETNGTLPDLLANIDKIDCVSLDIKLKEQISQNWKDEIFENELMSIKSLIKLKKRFYCKLVVFPSTELATLEKIGKELSNVFNLYNTIDKDININNYNKNNHNTRIPIVIQPVSPVDQWKNQSNLLFKFSETIGQYVEVLTIPQIHRFLNIE
ncbi:7-carboxy-7-deazaguanine synthase [Candidatus Methanobinarius endosymbioticus]|uniref:7-carboxy-7-deazaguanine synthase n=1 Tax=Candidatus Methanobinarius endosymbioticus TaxID=2006182 RepID=A0A366M7Q1_9EURY|nr:7-carboxy-7-deazaguanine synthase [Candidatus Methanobinarius endosymbioticus]